MLFFSEDYIKKKMGEDLWIPIVKARHVPEEKMVVVPAMLYLCFILLTE